MSPSRVSVACLGLATIRAYRAMGAMRQINEDRVDASLKIYYASNACNRWLGLRLDFVGAFLFLFAAGFLILLRKSLSPGIVGLTLGYALQFAFRLNWLVRQSIDVEVNLNSVERVREYCLASPEGFSDVEGTPTVAQVYGEVPRPFGPMQPSMEWPIYGKLEFQNVSMRYRPGTPLVLRDLTVPPPL